MPRVKLLRTAVLGAAFLVLASPAWAATIFGNIIQSGAPVVAAQLSLACPGLSEPARTETDGQGNYHFSLGAQGNCTLSIQHGSASTATSVILEVNPNRYDFELVVNGAGASLVRR